MPKQKPTLRPLPFARRLKSAIEKAGLTQGDVVDRCRDRNPSSKLDEPQLSKYLSGITPKDPTVKPLASVLDQDEEAWLVLADAQRANRAAKKHAVRMGRMARQLRWIVEDMSELPPPVLAARYADDRTLEQVLGELNAQLDQLNEFFVVEETEPTNERDWETGGWDLPDRLDLTEYYSAEWGLTQDESREYREAVTNDLAAHSVDDLLKALSLKKQVPVSAIRLCLAGLSAVQETMSEKK